MCRLTMCPKVDGFAIANSKNSSRFPLAVVDRSMPSTVSEFVKNVTSTRDAPSEKRCSCFVVVFSDENSTTEAQVAVKDAVQSTIDLQDRARLE